MRGAAPAADVDVVLVEPTVAHGAIAPMRPTVLGIVGGGRIVVATLLGRPCRRCFEPALAATETLRVLLLAPHRGRITRVSMLTGDAFAADLAPTDGCELCEGGA